MTLTYTLITVNFLLMIASWFVSYKIFKNKTTVDNQEVRTELDNIRKDLDLVARNPAQARRELKKR